MARFKGQPRDELGITYNEELNGMMESLILCGEVEERRSKSKMLLLTNLTEEEVVLEDREGVTIATLPACNTRKVPRVITEIKNTGVLALDVAESDMEGDIPIATAVEFWISNLPPTNDIIADSYFQHLYIVPEGVAREAARQKPDQHNLFYYTGDGLGKYWTLDEGDTELT